MSKRWVDTRWLAICLAAVAMTSRAQEILPVEGEPEAKPAVQAFEDADRYVEFDDQIRLCSYNIQDFFDGADEGRRTWEHVHRQARVAGAILDDINADILVLQEIQSAEVLRLLNEKLERPFAVGYLTSFGTGMGRMNRLNLAVLSRFPLGNVTELDFTPMSGEGRPTRGLLRFEVDPGEEDLMWLVYNVHLKANWGDQQRNISQRFNALALLRQDWSNRVGALEGDAAWEVLVAGDFNVDPAHPSFEGDQSLAPLSALVDLWAGRALEERITVPTRYGVPDLEFPPVAFDRFYASEGLTDGPWVIGQPYVLPKGVNIDDVQMVAGEDESMASDHYPIFIDLYRSRN